MKVHDLGGYILRNYVLETDAGMIAIDTGYPGGCDTFIKRFERKWPLSSLRYIFLTHHHDDHAGFLADLLTRTDAVPIVHHLAVAPLAKGESYEPPGSGYSSRPGSWFGVFKKDFLFPAVSLGENAVILHDETQQVFEAMGLPLRIVFLPGHTADSMGLFLPETGQLFCGDAAMNAVISVARHTIWIDDAEQFGKSWDRMLSLSPSRIYPSHGSPFPPRDLVRYRNYLQGKTLL